MTDYPYKDTTKPEVTVGRTSHVGAAVLNPGFATDQPADVPGRFRTYKPTLEISGGSTVGVEEELELTLTATYVDAHGEDVEVDATARATWYSSDVTKATVEAGVVTGVAAGSTTITAVFDGVTQTQEVTVTAD